jgi:hypothetical protein
MSIRTAIALVSSSLSLFSAISSAAIIEPSTQASSSTDSQSSLSESGSSLPLPTEVSSYLSSEPGQYVTHENLDSDTLQSASAPFTLSPQATNHLPVKGFRKTDEDVLSESNCVSGLIRDKAVRFSAIVSDVGVAVVKSFKLAMKEVGPRLEVDLSPKIQRLSTYNYRVTANDLDSTAYGNRIYTNGVNLDAAVTLHTEQWKLSLTADNLISRTIDTMAVDGTSYTYQMEPYVNISARREMGLVRFGADVDLTQGSGFEATERAQYAHVGLELDSSVRIMWRAGYNREISRDYDGLWSAGVRFSPIEAMHFDFGGDYSDEGELGGKFSIGVTF